MRRVLLISSAALVLLACKEAHVPRMIQISEAAASRTTEIATGDALRITLAENITTGYSWQIDMANCAGALRLDSDQPERPGGPPGAGGQRTWTFTALHEAQCALRFRSVRPWEKTATGTSLVFAVAIRKGP